MRNRKLALIAVTAMVAVALSGCGQAKSTATDTAPESTETASGSTETETVSEEKITRVADVEIPAVPDITPTQENGVISAEEWKPYYPAIVASQEANSENNERVSYIEENPNIKILYQGYGFAIDYTSAIGHTYTLEDVAKTQRPHKLANCLTCKTPDYTALVNSMGDAAYSLDFEEVYKDMHETVSCYICHENTPGTMVLTHDYSVRALSDNIADGTVNPINASCGQCHIEYYFDPTTKATNVPYTGPENFDPDSILAYYNDMGFADYTNPENGTPIIKVQHPEFETFTGAGSVHGGTFTCADCHMGVSYDENGDAYVSHKFTSPLDNQELIDSTCSACHSDLAGFVHGIQEETTAREDEISDMLVEISEKLTAAVKDGSKTEDELNNLRQRYREAQFYWDFVYVENSEGAHNRVLTKDCLDKAETMCKETLALL